MSEHFNFSSDKTKKTYSFKGKNNRGKEVSGEIIANNISLAKTMLRKQGIEVTKISLKSGASLLQFGKKINSSDICLFSRQMATMQNAGIPLVQALGVIIESSEKQSVSALVKSLKEDIEQGSSFSNA